MLYGPKVNCAKFGVWAQRVTIPLTFGLIAKPVLLLPDVLCVNSLTSMHSQLIFKMRTCHFIIVKKNRRYTGYNWRNNQQLPTPCAVWVTCFMRDRLTTAPQSKTIKGRPITCAVSHWTPFLKHRPQRTKRLGCKSQINMAYARHGGSFCSAFGCSNNKSVNAELSFFRFPKDKDR